MGKKEREEGKKEEREGRREGENGNEYKWVGRQVKILEKQREANGYGQDMYDILRKHYFKKSWSNLILHIQLMVCYVKC